MKKFTLFLASILMGFYINAQECNNLTSTSGTYSENDALAQACQNEFGSNYTVADWTDLEAISNINAWISCMGLTDNQSFNLLRNGQQIYSGSRQYYMKYCSDGDPGSNFLIHDQIGSYIFLGSWSGSRNVLAKNTSSSGDTCLSDNFNDGDWTNNMFWDAWNNDDHPGSISVVNNDYVKFHRTGAGGNGGKVLLTHVINASINSNTAVKFDVNPVFSDVGNGAGWNDGEYPINVWLYLRDASNNQLILQFAYNYRGGSSLTQSDYIREAFPNCAQDTWLNNEQFTIQDYFPQASQIDSIRLGSRGWNYEGYIDNVELLNCSGGNTSIIEQSPKNNIKLFPNPTKDKLIIELQEKTNGQIQIINSLGQSIHTISISNNNVIDMSPYKHGIYFLVIKNNKGNILLSKKIVKE